MSFVVTFTPTIGTGTTYVIDCANYTDAVGYMRDYYPGTFHTHTRTYSPGHGCDLRPAGTVLRLRAGRR